MKHEMPPELVALLSQHMDPADVAAAELVTTDAPKPARRFRNPFNTLYISYVPQLKSFSAHKHGIPEIRASSLPALLARIEELWPGERPEVPW